jgi:hypothetical protein
LTLALSLPPTESETVTFPPRFTLLWLFCESKKPPDVRIYGYLFSFFLFSPLFIDFNKSLHQKASAKRVKTLLKLFHSSLSLSLFFPPLQLHNFRARLFLAPPPKKKNTKENLENFRKAIKVSPKRL